MAVPVHLREGILHESHGGLLVRHFSGAKLYQAVSRLLWWSTLYKDVMELCRNCPECSIVTGAGRKQVPLLHPNPVEGPFQILGVDIMEQPNHCPRESLCCSFSRLLH